MKQSLIILSCLLHVAGAYAAVPPSKAAFLKPGEAIAKMSVPDGFEVKAFVAEPDIGEAIAFCFDDRGRLWTLENHNYQTRKSHSKDMKNRIQIFEDTDGDGVFNTKKLFSDQLTFSSGIAVGFGGVYVGTPPNLVFIPDANGDDKPDGEPEILLDGWGTNDRHETLNSFIWGPDGWLYGCHGVFTQSKVGRPGTPADKRAFIDGGIWRFHPVRKSFEVFAHGLSNPWGFDFNDHGQGFATCCVIPHLFHIIQGGVYHKQSRANINPYVYDNIKTIRDHTHKSAHGGARFYLADAFPAEYHDRLFMCNIHQHSVLTDVMVPKGSGFVGKHGDDFLPANDLAWVGFSVEIGPEGAVYILDWHDQDICGNSVRFPESGRVYRITPKNMKPVARPDLASLSDAQLVDLQLHANDWYVRHARVLLHHRAVSGKLKAAAVHAQLEKMLASTPSSGKRLRALWALHVTGGLTARDSERLVKLLDHDDPYLRAWSVQLLCEEGKPPSRALAAFARMARTDASPVVRLYLAAALQRLPFEQRWPILENLASHEEDVEDHNIPRMLWLALEPMVPGNDAKALELALASKMPKLQEFVPRRLLGETTKKNVRGNNPKIPKPSPRWQTDIQRVAPGFTVKDVGEGGVRVHESFRNRLAVQTHPLKRGVPSVLSKTVQVPKGQVTTLMVTVSHHPHGDFELRVKVDGKTVSREAVSSKTVTDEWLSHRVDLSSYAGKTIQLQVENVNTGWSSEWAYWHEVKVSSRAPAPRRGAAKEPDSGKAKIVFISGKRSHGRMAHEHRAGNMLLARRLTASGLDVEPLVLPDAGYPKDPSVLDDAATIVIFCTGHRGHVLNPNLDAFDALMKKGVGVVMIHWATEAEKGKPGEKFLEWMGGFCDLDWSVNPHWKGRFTSFPDHPICNGVEPFAVHDEWYYHMRFVEDRKGFTSILHDLPPPETLKRPDGTRSGNPAVRQAIARGEQQTVAWAYERPGGGRGFGFTGGHNHLSWQSDGFRKIVLNAILWTAGVEVPPGGFDSKRPYDIEIKSNLD
jgi:putative membrane-bound dehydrogenase-like protein